MKRLARLLVAALGAAAVLDLLRAWRQPVVAPAPVDRERNDELQDDLTLAYMVGYGKGQDWARAALAGAHLCGDCKINAAAALRVDRL